MSEETKLIIEALSGLGESGVTAFIVWLVVNACVQAAKYTVIAIVPVAIVRIVMNAINRSEERKYGSHGGA